MHKWNTLSSKSRSVILLLLLILNIPLLYQLLHHWSMRLFNIKYVIVPQCSVPNIRLRLMLCLQSISGRSLKYPDLATPLLLNNLRHVVQLSSEKDASSWLFVLPIEEHGFVHHKGAFWDALCLWYGWLSSGLPAKCICGHGFTVDHAMNCSFSFFPNFTS